jgi:hypothetical protein
MRFNQMVAVRGAMPNGGTNQIEIAVCSIPALLAMKGYAVHNRLKQKDAYDIYYCIRNYPDGIDALAKDCLPLLKLPSGATATDSSTKSSTRSMALGPPVSRTSSRNQRFSETGRPINGSRMHSARSMRGCVPWG